MEEEAHQKGCCARTAGEIGRVTAAEWKHTINDMKDTKPSWALFLAIFCVFIVILGNVVLLISINFWISIIPNDEVATTSSRIAVQVVILVFLNMIFFVCSVIFVCYFGFAPIWRTLTATNRARRPIIRFLLLIASGATNAVTGIMSAYAMSHTPEFVQAVLLSIIPFSAQAWTYLLVRNERKRRYCSLTFIFSFVFLVSGVILSSLSSFLDKEETGKKAPVGWAVVFAVSSVTFGLWCVVQRLYFDTVVIRETEGGDEGSEEDGEVRKGGGAGNVSSTAAPGEAPTDSVDKASVASECAASTPVPGETPTASQAAAPTATPGEAPVVSEEGGAEHSGVRVEEAAQEESGVKQERTWGKQNEDDYAAKMTLLAVGIFFHLLVTFLLLPVDVIPTFGTSKDLAAAWVGFTEALNFMFASWENIRYGLLNTLGYFLSLVGCAYLNEHSPTLASVVLQLAGPVTGVVLIIVPQWDVYGKHGVVGQKVGGVILLVIAGMLYHIWYQASSYELYNQKPRSDENSPDEVNEENMENITN